MVAGTRIIIAAPRIVAAMMIPSVTRFATRWRTVCSRSSSRAFTRMLNSPSARLSRIRLPRLGSIEVNSFASIAAP